MKFDSNHQALAVQLREAIVHTTNMTISAGADAKCKFISHLDFLLAQERILFTRQIDCVSVAPTGPWYPDNSMGWVEVSTECISKPAALSSTDAIEVLLDFERTMRNYQRSVNDAANFNWNANSDARIVAYKVVKPDA